MNLSKTQKILVGVLHFLPFIGFIAYFVLFFSLFFNNLEELQQDSLNGNPPLAFFRSFIGLFVIIILTVFIALGIKIFDIIHLTKSNKNDTNNKVLIWILLFVFTGIISEIIYYFLEIVPDKKEELEGHKTNTTL
ncbi:hypothetical protein [Flavobacterium profundi]|uniref:hypothetical protein n=1 Tax=Flavobacterium profundi TaxID=1774945 RepID=UPI0018DBE6FC|nr:hypothetical protein [Flavobacterium profundi]